MNQPTQLSSRSTSASRSQRGFITGCFTFLIIVCLLFALLLWWGRSKVRDFVIDFTDTSPLAIASLNVSDTEINSAIDKAALFIDSVQKLEKPARIELTGKEINALLAGVHRLVEPQLDNIRDHKTGEKIELTEEQKKRILEEWKRLPQMLRVEIHGDRVKGKLSIPLQRYAPLGWLGIDEERYLTGRASFSIALQGDSPKVDIDYLEVKGEQVPSQVLDEIKNRMELQKEIDKHTEGEIPFKITTLKVTEGRLIVETAPKGSASSAGS